MLSLTNYGYARKRGMQGFTILEVLIVIAIIMILAGLTFPIIGIAKERAKRTACISNLRQLGMAVKMYVEDYKGNMFGMCYPYEDKYSAGTVINAYHPYIKDDNIFMCPSDTKWGKNQKSGKYAWPKTMSYRYEGTTQKADPEDPTSVRENPRNLVTEPSTDPKRFNCQAGLIFGDIRWTTFPPDVDPFHYPETGTFVTETPHAKRMYQDDAPYWEGLGHCVVYPDGHARYCQHWQRFYGPDLP